MKSLTFFLFLLFSATIVYSQQSLTAAGGQATGTLKMSYQAVVRDAGVALVTSQAVGMQLSIVQGSVSETVVYVEKQTPTSKLNDLVNAEIGAKALIL